MIKNCEICNIEFKIRPSRFQKSKTCSRACYEKTRPLTIYIYKCKECFKEFKITRKKQIFCSLACNHNNQKKEFAFWSSCSPEEEVKRLKELYERAAVKNESGCWGWSGQKNMGGYGVVRCGKKRENYKPKTISAHRLSWIINKGSIPEGLCVLHRCDSPPCSKIEHLFLGTHKDNSDDKISKGRWKGPTWDKHKSAKLNPDKVREIRNLLKEGESLRGVSIKYGVSKQTIASMKDGKTWKHVGYK